MNRSFASRAASAPRRLGNTAVLPVLERTLPREKGILEDAPPIFIVGAPRSGSTVLMQVLTTCLDVGYLSNRHEPWYGAPAIVEQFGGKDERVSSDFQSTHGRTTGRHGPSESAGWWYRFFPRDPVYTPRGSVSPQKASSLVRSLETMTTATGRPLLFKNLYASYRIPELTRIVPSARFVFLRRNLADNARSLLEGRRRVNQSYETWWSLRPPDSSDLDSVTPVRQVVAQVLRTNEIILRDAQRYVNRDSILEVRYEEFCAAPAATANQIATRFDVVLDEAAASQLPALMAAGPRAELPTEMERELYALGRT